MLENLSPSGKIIEYQYVALKGKSDFPFKKCFKCPLADDLRHIWSRTCQICSLKVLPSGYKKYKCIFFTSNNSLISYWGHSFTFPIQGFIDLTGKFFKNFQMNWISFSGKTKRQ